MAPFLSLLKQIAERLSLGSQTESLCERKWMCGRKWSVNVSGCVDVSGCVNVSGCVDVSGCVNVSGFVNESGCVNVSGYVDVSGCVNVGGGGSERQWMCEGKWIWVDGYGLMELSQEPFIIEHTARRVHADSFLTITTVPL